MWISFDPAKREKVLRERGLDFLDAPAVFESRSLTAVDDRTDYGETRYVTYGWLSSEAVAVVWTLREAVTRVISTRRMHQSEIEYVGLD